MKTENDHINLKVAGQDGSVVQFKIKRHTPLSKLMKAYCERQVGRAPFGVGKSCGVCLCCRCALAALGFASCMSLIVCLLPGRFPANGKVEFEA